MAKFNLKQALAAAGQMEEMGDYFSTQHEMMKANECWDKAREMRRLAHATARQIQRRKHERVETRRANLIASTMAAIYG